MPAAATAHARIWELAHRQHGVVSNAQAERLGVSNTSMRRLTGAGWRRVCRGIYVFGPDTFEQRVMAAVLWGQDAVASHGTAMALWRLEGWMNAIPEITVPLRACAVAPPTFKVHRAYVPDADRWVLQGIPVTGLARTLLDLSADLSQVDLAIAVEDARRRKGLDLSWPHRRLDVLHSQGRHGAANLRSVLADCGSRDGVLDSALEVRFWWMLKLSGLPLPHPGWRFDDAEGQPGRIDFAYPGIQLAVEVDGFAFHGARAAFERDRKRLSRLAALGWRVLHVTHVQMRDPETLLGRIRRALFP